MTSSINIGKYKKIPLHSCTWLNSISSYTNSAEIVVPGMVTLQEHDYAEKTVKLTRVPTSQVFSTGLPVEIYTGYDKRNYLRFNGFVAAVSLKDRKLVIKCEGYSYLLRKVIFSRGYKSVLLKDLLKDLVFDTPIKVSPFIPDVELTKLTFIKLRGTDVLDHLVKRCGLTIFFDNDELYAGLRYALASNKNGEEKKKKTFRIGWNTIDSDNLIFKEAITENNISLSIGNPDGHKTIITSGVGEKRVIKISHLRDDLFLQNLYKDLKKKTASGTYSGSYTAFGEPFVKPSDVVELLDESFPSRGGRYFVTEVNGSFSTSGLRQDIKIDLKLSETN